MIWLLDLFCVHLSKQSAAGSLDCCESYWLGQLSWHSSSSAHGRDNDFLGAYGVCSPQSFITIGKAFCSLLSSACAGRKMMMHPIRRLLCLPKDIPPTKQQQSCHGPIALWDCNLNYLTYCFKNHCKYIIHAAGFSKISTHSLWREHRH